MSTAGARLECLQTPRACAASHALHAAPVTTSRQPYPPHSLISAPRPPPCSVGDTEYGRFYRAVYGILGKGWGRFSWILQLINLILFTLAYT